MKEKKKKSMLLRKGELAFLSEQLALLMNSGLTAYDCLDLLNDTDADMSWLYSGMMRSMNEGQSLSMAAEAAGCFPAHFLTMLRVGEESGRTDEVLSSLAQYYRREEAVLENVRSSLRYPILILAVFFVVAVLIMALVIPIFGDIYSQLGVSISGITRILLAVGTFMNNNAILTVGLILAIIVGAVCLTRMTENSSILSAIVFSKKAIMMAGISSFASATSLCLKSGFTTAEAVEIASGLSETSKLREKASILIEKLNEGEEAADAFAAADILSPLDVGILRAGSKTGSIDGALDNISNRYEQQSAKTVAQSTESTEPALVIGISLVTGLLLLSVMLPLISVMTAL